MFKYEPVESFDFPGFYEIPGYRKYVISKEGLVIIKNSGEILEGSFLKKGYLLFNMTGDDGVRRGNGRHRLLGLVFKHPGVPIDNLVVNHKNGIPGDDDLENLEWTTHQGNIEHAGKNGLTKKCLPIAVRDVRSGEVVEYPSIVEYARLFGWSKDKVSWRIKVGEGRVFPEGKQYRPASVATPWYIPEDIEHAVLLNSRSRITLIKNVLSGKISEYPSLSEAARQLKISKAALSIWIGRSNMPVFPGFIQVKFAHDSRPWRPISDPYIEIEMTTGRRVVCVIEDKTQKSTIFTSLVECAKMMGLNPVIVSYRLKSKGNTLYQDGYRYIYYLDNILSQM